jgi:hypothetical protein
MLLVETEVREIPRRDALQDDDPCRIVTLFTDMRVIPLKRER